MKRIYTLPVYGVSVCNLQSTEQYEEDKQFWTKVSTCKHNDICKLMRVVYYIDRIWTVRTQCSISAVHWFVLMRFVRSIIEQGKGLGEETVSVLRGFIWTDPVSHPCSKCLKRWVSELRGVRNNTVLTNNKHYQDGKKSYSFCRVL